MRERNPFSSNGTMEQRGGGPHDLQFTRRKAPEPCRASQVAGHLCLLTTDRGEAQIPSFNSLRLDRRREGP